METRILAIDLDLEHYLRVIITDDAYTDITPGYVQLADERAEELILRYGLSEHEGDYDEANRKLEAILEAQKRTEVKYNSQ